MIGVNSNLSLLESLIPGGGLEVKPSQESLPLWLRQVATYYLVYMRGEVVAGLIMPKADLDYDVLVKVQKQMEKRTERPFLLIADELNPKYRSLFVRNKIPFVYKNASIFAPALGFKLTSMGWTKHKEKEPRIIDSLITSFELKLLAGFLTEHISLQAFNLDDLQMLLSRNQYKCSKNKLSRATKELIGRGLLTTKGWGPKRKLQFISKNEIWEYLLYYNPKRTSKIVEGYYVIPNAAYIYAGESALSQFSDLSLPVKPRYTLTNKQYQLVKRKGKTVGDFSSPQFYYELRKEEPKLFSVKGSLNPIELYFELKDFRDERIQIALGQMLRKLNLKVSDNE